MLRFPHCLQGRLTDGGKFVSLKHLPRSTHQEHFLLLALISVRGLANPQGLVRSEGLGTFKTCIHPIGSRTRLREWGRMKFNRSAIYRCRAVAQTVSRRLPTAAARIRAQVRLCGICGRQSGTGHVFFEYIGYPCQSFHKLLHTQHLASGAGTIRQ
jgi:hypothetical protein